MRDVIRKIVCQIGVLGTIPHLFIGIQFGSVSREPLDLKPLGETGL